MLPDINVLVYAHRQDTDEHRGYRDWLEAVVNAEAAYGLSDLVVSGFLRVVTHPRVFESPTPLADAMTFAGQIRDQPNRVVISPGNNHWRIFTNLCQRVDAKGNLIPDACLPAMAIESGCEWITADRDFGRFPGLKWRHPLRA